MKTITYNPETHVLVPREPNGIFPELPKHAPIIRGIVCYDAFQMHQFAIRYMDSVIAAAPQPEQVDVGSVGWKHDCAALCANDIELWIDRCPHCGKPRHNHPPTDDEYMPECVTALYTTPQPDRTAELEAALKVARDALNDCEGALDECRDYPITYSTILEALAKINEVLK